jgi:hypothetical protein
MMAAIVVPAGARSIVTMRACLVSGRAMGLDGEGADRVRVLDLAVDRDANRALALGFDFGLFTESSGVRATPSAAPPQPRRANHPAGQDPEAPLAAPSNHSNAPINRESQSILSKIVARWAKIPATVSRVRIPLAPPACPRSCVLQAISLAIEPSSRSHFQVEFWTLDRHNRRIILRNALFSPNLCTPPIRYGSRNSIVASYLQASAERGSAVSLG